MRIIETVNNIQEMHMELKDKYNSYIDDIVFIDLFDSQLDANLKSIIMYCKTNKMNSLVSELENYIPIQGNAVEVLSMFDSIKDTILECVNKICGNKRNEVINDIAYFLQDNMKKIEIEIFLSGYSIKYSENDYMYNSKRVYVQNILARVENNIILSIAKELQLLDVKIVKNQIIDKLDNSFVNEQMVKMQDKLANKDFDGSITNARSLIEEILLEIEADILKERQEYDGDLQKLYKRVRKMINLEPENRKIDNSLNEIMRGFISIISGFSAISNKMGDRHAREYTPKERHAILAVNSSILISEFLINSYLYQKS